VPLFGDRICFDLLAKKLLTWWTLQIELFSNTRDHRNNKLLNCLPDNRSSARAATVNGHLNIKNYLQGSKIKLGSIHKLETKENHEHSLIRAHTV